MTKHLAYTSYEQINGKHCKDKNINCTTGIKKKKNDELRVNKQKLLKVKSKGKYRHRKHLETESKHLG